MESSETGTCIHEEVEKNPSLGIKDLISGEIRAVALINGGHDLFGYSGEGLGSAVVVIYNSGCGLSFAFNNEFRLELFGLNSEKFALVMVKCQLYSGVEGKVRGDVIAGYINLSVLNVFGMNEFDLIDHVHLFQKHCANQTVKVTSCDKSSAHRDLPSLN